MANAPITTFKGPCHCCENALVQQAVCFALPNATVDYVNSIIAGYPDNCGSFPAPPAIGPLDWVQAMAIAHDVLLGIDFDHPPVPWGPIRPTSFGGAAISFQVITGGARQVHNANPPLNGILSNPNALNPDYWLSDTGFSIFEVFNSLTTNDTCQLGAVGFFSCCGLFVNPTFGLGPGQGGLITVGGVPADLSQGTVCDDSIGINGPGAFASRTRILNRTSICTSGRREQRSPSRWCNGTGAPRVTALGNCGLRVRSVGDPPFIFDPPDPTIFGGFDISGFGDNSDELYQEGTGIWFAPCEDCACP